MILRFFLLSVVLMFQGVVWPADTSSASAKSISGILKKLRSECDNPKISNESEWTSFGSATERKRMNYIADLRTAGAPAVAQVRQELLSAKGEYKDMLVIALSAFGDNTAIWQSSRLMLKAKLPAVRVCAAHGLRKLQDKRSIEPFKQALADTFKRMDGGCVGRKMIYPVRIIASSALVQLGVPFEEVRKLGRWSD